MELSHICKCNKCDARLFDENPKDDSPKQIPNGNELSMVQIDDDGEFFWGCPNCNTDCFLTDIEDER